MAFFCVCVSLINLRFYSLLILFHLYMKPVNKQVKFESFVLSCRSFFFLLHGRLPVAFILLNVLSIQANTFNRKINRKDGFMNN